MLDEKENDLLDYPVEEDGAAVAENRKKELVLLSFLLLLHFAFRFLAAIFPSEWYKGGVLFLGTLVPLIVFLCYYRGKRHLSHWLRHPVHTKQAFSVFPLLLSLGILIAILQSFLLLVAPNVGTAVVSHKSVPTILLFDLLLPAVGEELLFRGVVLQRLRHYGMRGAATVSAIAFAVAHGNWMQIPYAFLAGLLLGTVTLYTHSVMPAMVMHFLLNFVSVELSLVPLDVALYVYLAVLLVSFLLAVLWRRQIAKPFRALRRKERLRSPSADVLAMLLSSLGVVLLAEFFLSFRWF